MDSRIRFDAWRSAAWRSRWRRGVGAAAPRALAPASGGLVAGRRCRRKGAPRHSLCLADPVLLGQWEHRDARCTRTILSDEGNKARDRPTPAPTAASGARR